jgi:hypothetical protein
MQKPASNAPLNPYGGKFNSESEGRPDDCSYGSLYFAIVHY